MTVYDERYDEKKAAYERVRATYLQRVDAVVAAGQARREATENEERAMNALNQVQNELAHAALDMGYAQGVRDLAASRPSTERLLEQLRPPPVLERGTEYSNPARRAASQSPRPAGPTSSLRVQGGFFGGSTTPPRGTSLPLERLRGPAEQTPASFRSPRGGGLTCRVCGQTFPSGAKLAAHETLTGHYN
jgi:hypothetical protein